MSKVAPSVVLSRVSSLSCLIYADVCNSDTTSSQVQVVVTSSRLELRSTKGLVGAIPLAAIASFGMSTAMQDCLGVVYRKANGTVACWVLACKTPEETRAALKTLGDGCNRDATAAGAPTPGTPLSPGEHGGKGSSVGKGIRRSHNHNPAEQMAAAAPATPIVGASLMDSPGMARRGAATVSGSLLARTASLPSPPSSSAAAAAGGSGGSSRISQRFGSHPLAVRSGSTASGAKSGSSGAAAGGGGSQRESQKHHGSRSEAREAAKMSTKGGGVLAWIEAKAKVGSGQHVQTAIHGLCYPVCVCWHHGHLAGAGGSQKRAITARRSVGKRGRRGVGEVKVHRSADHCDRRAAPVSSHSHQS